MSARDTVITATERLFNTKDVSAVDELFGPTYTQHSALAPDGTDGLRGLVSSLSPESHYDLVRVVAGDDLVVTQGVFHGFAPVPLLGFDVWRLADGRIVEHWDALGPLPAPAAGAPSALDGPTDPRPAADPAASRAVVEARLEGLLSGAPEHAHAGHPVAEHGAIPAGLTYVTLHTVIAEGDLVYTRSEGDLGGTTMIVNELWRVEGADVAEHWSLVTPVPPTLPHDNGAF